MGGKGSGKRQSEKTQHIIAALRAGKRCAEIATEFKCTRANVYLVRKKYLPASKPHKRWGKPVDLIEGWRQIKLEQLRRAAMVMLEESQRVREKHVYYTGPDRDERRRYKAIVKDCLARIKALESLSADDLEKAKAVGLMTFLRSKG